MWFKDKKKTGELHFKLGKKINNTNDILEDFDFSGDNGPIFAEKKIKKKRGESIYSGANKFGVLKEEYGLYDFLVHEEQRLKVIIDFSVNKLPNRVKYSQTQLIISQEEEKKKKYQENLFNILSDSKSHLQVNLADLFNRSFQFGETEDHSK